VKKSKLNRVGLEYEEVRENVKKMLANAGLRVGKPQIDNMFARVIKENNLYPKVLVPKKGKKKKDEVFI